MVIFQFSGAVIAVDVSNINSNVTNSTKCDSL